MLSRIKPNLQVATFDTDEYVHPDAFPDEQCDMRTPLEADKLDKVEVIRAQKEEFAKLLEEVSGEDSGYVLADGLLYSREPVSPTAAKYPRLVLPKQFRKDVIDRCHREVGHQAVQKTLERIRDSYIWGGMRKDITQWIKSCPTCQVHQRRLIRTGFEEMPLPASPMQVIGMDLTGPFARSTRGNQYLLNIVDHCMGWLESYPIP